jgi:DNA primase
MSDVKQAIAKFNLFSYLQTADLSFDTTKGGAEYVLECPKCYKKKLSLCAEGDKKGVWHCYRCSASGNLFDLMAEIEGIDPKAAFKKVVKNQNFSSAKRLDVYIKGLDEKTSTIPANDEVEMPSGFSPLLTVKDSNVGRVYAAKRGITEADMRDFDIRYDYVDKRIVFPVYFGGKLVGWQGRDASGRSDTDKKHPKALTGPSSRDGKGFKKSWVFYGWDRVKNASFVTIVEGPIDAIKGKEVNAIAILGKSMSEVQFKILIGLKKAKTVFIALDPDAKQEKMELAQKLRPFFKEVRIVDLPEGKDFGNSSKRAIKEYLYLSCAFQHQLMMTLERRR